MPYFHTWQRHTFLLQAWLLLENISLIWVQGHEYMHVLNSGACIIHVHPCVCISSLGVSLFLAAWSQKATWTVRLERQVSPATQRPRCHTNSWGLFRMNSSKLNRSFLSLDAEFRPSKVMKHTLFCEQMGIPLRDWRLWVPRLALWSSSRRTHGRTHGDAY